MPAFKEKEPATPLENLPKDNGGIAGEGSDEAAVCNDDFPDGGKQAWLVVIGAMCSMFAAFGYINSWGIFQTYYQTHQLKNSSPSSIAWLGSIQYAFVLVPGLIVGRLFDLGYFRSMYLTSSALAGTTFLTAECKEYWQFLLCQGILVGLTCGGIFSPNAALIAQWFKKRRGLAASLVAIGGSIGAIVYPLVARWLINRIGFQWTIRVFGFIALGALGVSTWRRLPPGKKPGGIIDFRAFKSPAYSVYCASAFFSFLGIYTLLTYVGESARSVGISSTFVFYFVAIINAGSLIGRPCAGHLSDKIGPLNVMVPCTAAVGILTYAWPFVQTKIGLITLGVFYGFSSGAYVSLSANPVMEMSQMDDVGRLTGMFISCLAVGALIGPPISSAIAHAGSCIVMGLGMMCLTRHLLLK